MVSPLAEVLAGGVVGSGLVFCGGIFSILLSSTLLSLMGGWIWWGLWMSTISLGLVNLSGLVSYSWAFTLYPVSSSGLAWGVWVGVVLSSINGNQKWLCRLGSHYLPAGAPLWLWLVLPVLEVISVLVRPLVLVLRLSANLLSGHLLLALVGGLLWSGALGGLFILVHLELFVSVVQAGVLVLLLGAYADER